MPWIIGLTLFQGVVNAVEIPTRQSFVVRMIDDRADLGNAIALNSSNFNATRLVGPAIGGAVVAAVGEGYCFLIDGLSYIAVIAGLLAMRLTPDERPPASNRRVLEELADGWRYVVQSTPIRSLLIFLAAVGVMSTPYTVLMPLVAGRTLGGGAAHAGLADGGVGRRRAHLRGAAGAAHHRRRPRPADGADDRAIFGAGLRPARPLAVVLGVAAVDGAHRLRPDVPGGRPPTPSCRPSSTTTSAGA